MVHDLLHGLPFLQKLWDKGIDIWANAITALIVAGASFGFWMWKGMKWRDLRLETAKHQLVDERTQKQKAERAQEFTSDRRKELVAIISAAETAQDPIARSKIWQQYEVFLRTWRFETSPVNLLHAKDRDSMRGRIEYAMRYKPDDVEALQQDMIQLMRTTNIDERGT